MAFIYRLELEDGTPADPPTFRSASAVTWSAGDTIPMGRKTLRVIAVRDDDADRPPALVVEEVEGGRRVTVRRREALLERAKRYGPNGAAFCGVLRP